MLVGASLYMVEIKPRETELDRLLCKHRFPRRVKVTEESDDLDTAHENHEKKILFSIPVIIILVRAAFVAKSGLDSWVRISISDSTVEKTNICMGR